MQELSVEPDMTYFTKINSSAFSIIKRFKELFHLIIWAYHRDIGTILSLYFKELEIHKISDCCIEFLLNIPPSCESSIQEFRFRTSHHLEYKLIFSPWKMSSSVRFKNGSNSSEKFWWDSRTVERMPKYCYTKI